MLKKATEIGHYEHYHLISGEDLPIQRQADIQAFFEDNAGKEFVGFDKSVFTFGDRVYYKWILQEHIGKKWSPLKIIRNGFIFFQKKLKIMRNRDIHFQKGANWFSITYAMALYVLSMEEWCREIFKNSFCADEIFLQTIVVNSPFKSNLYWNKFDDSHQFTQRCVDWKRGKPYTWRIDDLKELMDSPLMFARKFDCNIDDRVILEIKRIYGN